MGNITDKRSQLGLMKFHFQRRCLKSNMERKSRKDGKKYLVLAKESDTTRNGRLPPKYQVVTIMACENLLSSQVRIKGPKALVRWSYGGSPQSICSFEYMRISNTDLTVAIWKIDWYWVARSGLDSPRE